jgi:hypothetical protein
MPPDFVLKYNPRDIIETERWWFIPCGWAGYPGRAGCIVDKADFSIDWLGTGSLEMSFWGHDHGLNHDLADFTFAPGTDLILAETIVRKFLHMRPNAAGKLPCHPIPYRDSEITSAVSAQFPVFKRHYVGLAIHEIRHAYENEGLRFSSTRAEES